MGLRPDQIARFHEDGYLVVEDVLSPADLQPVIQEVSEAIDREARALMAQGELSRSYADEPYERRLAYITAETEAVYWSICSGNLHGPGVFDLITNPKLLNLAESLVGPEIIASSVYRLRPKVPGFAHGIVPWHQDSGYFEPYCDDELVLTMWIPLVEATPERGCLRVVRHAHTTGVVPHRRETDGTGYLEIPEPHLPLNDIVTVPVSLGGVLLLTNRTPHCSGDNVTDVIRWSVDIRYQSADLPTNYDSPSGWTNEQLPHDAPIACYPPEADFLVKSRRRPGDIVRDPETFSRIRRRHVESPATVRWA